jgi:hypothetical protein
MVFGYGYRLGDRFTPKYDSNAQKSSTFAFAFIILRACICLEYDPLSGLVRHSREKSD